MLGMKVGLVCLLTADDEDEGRLDVSTGALLSLPPARSPNIPEMSVVFGRETVSAGSNVP